VQIFGNMAHVFSVFESRSEPGAKPFDRGINSIQLCYEQNRWWVVNIMWTSETPENPVPSELLFKTE
jgi:hypothetical protein